MLNVLLIVSEIGVDMSKWRSAKAFCSWLGLCPGNKISGGKVLDSRTRQVVNRVADALRLAAQSAGRTEICLGIFYRRKLAHLGAPKATTAVDLYLNRRNALRGIHDLNAVIVALKS